MNVQQLIDELTKIEDKTLPIRMTLEYGHGCSCVGEIDSVDEDDGKGGVHFGVQMEDYPPYVQLSGVEDPEQSEV